MTTPSTSAANSASAAARPAVARRLQPFGTTVFAEITAKAVATDSINLGQGFPEADGPDFIKDALARALREHPNQYAPMPGIPALRDAIAARFAARTGLPATADHVTVTSGCTEALPAATLGLLDPGEKVILLEPFYDEYPVSCAMAGAEPIFVSLREQADASFAFDPDELARAAATPGCRAIMLNTPHNPTGKVFSRDELETIAGLAREHDLLVISDEVYDRLMFDDAEHVSIASLEGMWDRTVTLSSFGKTYSLTGWKLGWAIAPPQLTAAVRSAHQFLTFSVHTPTQHAAAHAMTSDEGETWIKELTAELADNRDRLAAALAELGFRFRLPESGYFILADHRAISEPLGITDDRAFVEHVIDRCRIAAIPPSAFYSEPSKPLGHPLIRFAFCKTPATIDAAIGRLGALKA